MDRIVTAGKLLSADGWEDAYAYHMMLMAAHQGQFVMVMPDLQTSDGQTAMYRAPYAEHLAPLVDARDGVRAEGFATFAVGAHWAARQVLAASKRL